jgi:hypothetical protein
MNEMRIMVTVLVSFPSWALPQTGLIDLEKSFIFRERGRQKKKNVCLFLAQSKNRPSKRYLLSFGFYSFITQILIHRLFIGLLFSSRFIDQY